MSVLVNAALLEISSHGQVDRYGDPSGPVQRWAGNAGGYLKRVDRTVLSGGQQIRLRRDILTILDTAGSPVSVIAGADWEADTVLVSDQRTTPPSTVRFTVIGIEHRAAGTIADSLRLELEPAAGS